MFFTLNTSYFLLLLLLLPCFVWCRLASQNYYFSKLIWIKKKSIFTSWLTWLKLLLFSLMVLALSEPIVYEKNTHFYKKGRDLILTLDASGSMNQSGFNKKEQFKTKFQSNLELASDFAKQRFDDNMGVVVFGTFAYTASALTYDLEALSYLLNLTNVGIAGESTAIGDALMQSIRTLSFGTAKSKVILLFTDGYHNAGLTSPKQAVVQAIANGIKIYTIGLGKKSNYDAKLLETIAKETNAKSYSATSAKELQAIYQEINTLEPSSIRSENYLNQKLLIFIPLGVVFILLLLWILFAQRGTR